MQRLDKTVILTRTKNSSSCDFYPSRSNSTDFDRFSNIDTTYSPTKNITYNFYIYEHPNSKKKPFRLRNIRHIDINLFEPKNDLRVSSRTNHDEVKKKLYD